MANKIFINYRRKESLKDARHLATLLDTGPFRGRVFIDTKGLDGASDWLHELERQVAGSVAMISVICKDWIDIPADGGGRRIDLENDFVRFELAEAFRRSIPVIPVLVDGARMPAAEKLPPNLLLLSRPQANLLRAETFEADVAKIAARVQNDIRLNSRRGLPGWVTGVIAAGALAAGTAAGPFVMPLVGVGPQAPPPTNAEAARRIGELERQLADADRVARSAQAARLKAEGEVATAQGEVKAAQAEVARVTAARDAARKDAADQRTLVEARTAEVAGTKAALAEETARRTRSETETQNAQAALAAVMKSLDRATSERDAAAKALDGAQREIAALKEKPPTPRDRIAALPPGSGQSARDCDDKDASGQFICPELVVVPAGTGQLGSPKSEKQRLDEDGPGGKPVILRIKEPFAVGRFAVTRGEFAAFVRAKSYDPKGCNAWAGTAWKFDEKKSWRDPGFAQDDDRHPVVCVSHADAEAYVAWLKEKTGKAYTLLSEAQREYVARAGKATAFWWDDTIGPNQANYDARTVYEGGGSKGDWLQRTVRVDSFAANPWGLYNVHGNVWEWTLDCWHPNNDGNPGDGSARTKTGDCSRRVVRGGSWYDFPQTLRAAYRNRNTADYRNDYLGFRVGRTLTP